MTTDTILPDLQVSAYQAPLNIEPASAESGIVYLLHLERPLSPDHTAQHYLGWTSDLAARAQAHRAGGGARFTEVAVEREISFCVVRAWYGGRDFERRLKRRKEAPRLCPLCGPALGVFHNELSPEALVDALIAW